MWNSGLSSCEVRVSGGRRQLCLEVVYLGRGGAGMGVSFTNMDGYTERRMYSWPLFKIAVFTYLNGFSLYLSITDGSLLPKDIFTPVHTVCMLMHVICMYAPHLCLSI